MEWMNPTPSTLPSLWKQVKKLIDQSCTTRQKKKKTQVTPRKTKKNKFIKKKKREREKRKDKILFCKQIWYLVPYIT